MAPQSPFNTEKPVTFAKVKPSVPAANSRSPNRPRKAVVVVVFANHARFMAIRGNAIPRCTWSSDVTVLNAEEIHDDRDGNGDDDDGHDDGGGGAS